MFSIYWHWGRLSACLEQQFCNRVIIVVIISPYSQKTKLNPGKVKWFSKVRELISSKTRRQTLSRSEFKDVCLTVSREQVEGKEKKVMGRINI